MKVNETPAHFVPSQKLYNYNVYVGQFVQRFEYDDMAFQKNGYYFILEDSTLLMAYKPLNDQNVDVYNVFPLEREYGRWEDEFERCLVKHIKDKRSEIYNLCKKSISMDDSLFSLVVSFFDSQKESIEKYNACTSYLHVVYYGENTYNDKHPYRYFDMPNPGCFENESIMYDPRIKNYIDLYKGISSMLKQNFEECRWDNFGNKDLIIDDCSRYHYEWVSKYGRGCYLCGVDAD